MKVWIVTIVIIGAILAGIVLNWQSEEIPEEEPQTSSGPAAPSVPVDTEEEKRARIDRYNAEASRALRFDQSKARLANDPMDDSQLSKDALLIDSPEATELEVKTALHSLLTRVRYFSASKSFPTGLNVEITNSLLGLNDRKVGFLPMDSLRINENGELIDEFGTPYWFHSKTPRTLTITSAGPDKLMHTEDDLEYPNEP